MERAVILRASSNAEARERFRSSYDPTHRIKSVRKVPRHPGHYMIVYVTRERT